MNRTELFDILIKNRVESEKQGFLDLRAYSEQKLNITDRALLESIIDEMIERGWVKTKSSTKYSVCATFAGIEMIEKYGSYKSFLESINKLNTKKRAEKITKNILSIIGGIGIIYGCFFTYLNYEKNNEIEKQKNEIDTLNKKIDSLKTELKKTTPQHHI
jgi:polyhydroxyalkanoate synthesis regulator phasin